jgi:hypothetical protein
VPIWREPSERTAVIFFLLIRKTRREPRRMARQNRDLKAINNSVQRNRLRSSLFRWMVAHHDTILASWNGEKIDWRTFCAALAELGLTDTRGRPATEGNARETWRQARKAIAKARAAEAAKVEAKPARTVFGHPVYPSRMKDTRPENAPPPPARTTGCHAAPAGHPSTCEAPPPSLFRWPGPPDVRPRSPCRWRFSKRRRPSRRGGGSTRRPSR